jgi:hypothetical protein
MERPDYKTSINGNVVFTFWCDETETDYINIRITSTAYVSVKNEASEIWMQYSFMLTAKHDVILPVNILDA